VGNDFTLNEADGNGGAVALDGAGWVNFISNRFVSNRASLGGAVSYACPIK
jgi:hypothetical protein